MALIGRNISHSKSKEIYEKLLSDSVDYTLLDYENSFDIPELSTLLSVYSRISITAPYKNDVFKKIDSFPNNELGLKSVNAIKLKEGKVIGVNTDLLAFEKIYNQKFKSFNDILILGDGNVSKMIQKFFRNKSIDFNISSRKLDGFSQIDLFLDKKTLFINTCLRSYDFNYRISSSSCFWDMNYNHSFHQKHFAQDYKSYLDGLSLLEEQASFALSFWN